MAMINGAAAELARQAAGAAGGGAAAKANGGTGWKPPVLARKFDLDKAVETATVMASRVMNRQLAPDGLVVKRPQGVAESPAQQPIFVAEKATERVLKEYNTGAFLAFFAGREQRTGVIVDGQV